MNDEVKLKLNSLTLDRAKWIPTKSNPNRRDRVSYHISALYSPLRMEGWDRILTNWQLLEQGTDDLVDAKKQVFVNETLGYPYRPRGIKPKLSKIVQLKGLYVSEGEVEDDCLYAAFGADVQRSKKNPRVELEMVIFKRRLVTWSWC